MLALIVCGAAAFAPVLPSFGRPAAAARSALCGVRCGFAVETVDDKARDEMGIMGWPGVEKRSSDFEQAAAADELLYVYVKDGSGRVSDGEDTADVVAGQLVLLQDGQLRWTDVEDVTLLSLTMPADTQPSDELVAPEAAAEEEDKDLSPLELAGVLAAGLLSGFLLSNGLRLILLDESGNLPVS
jgi:hypothetical protein